MSKETKKIADYFRSRRGPEKEEKEDDDDKDYDAKMGSLGSIISKSLAKRFAKGK